MRRSTGFDRAAGAGRPLVALAPGSLGAESYRRLAEAVEAELDGAAAVVG